MAAMEHAFGCAPFDRECPLLTCVAGTVDVDLRTNLAIRHNGVGGH